MSVADGVGYGISEETRSDARLAFLFHGAGLETARIVRDFRLVQGTASGDEIDRLDYGNAVIIAASRLAGGHSDEFLMFNEESMFPMTNATGTTSDKIRSDLVFYQTAARGRGLLGWSHELGWCLGMDEL